LVKGFPVVLSDRGAPFVAVEKNAPLATVAENGRGLPIRLVEKGAPPLIVDGLGVFFIAGESEDALQTGYSSGSVIPKFGYFNGSPVEGHAVVFLVTFEASGDIYLQVAIEGDVASELNGASLWVNGDSYEPDIAWTYQAGIGTMGVFSGFPFMFEVGEKYEIEIKQPE
jgi:hypothetical protein